MTVVLITAYGFGVRIVQAHTHPMWKPRLTRATRPNEPEESPERESMHRLWIEFALSAIVVMAAGWAVSRTGASIAAQTGISESIVGALLVAVATSFFRQGFAPRKLLGRIV